MSRAICGATLWALAGLAGLAHAEPRTDPTAGRAVFSGAATPSPTSIEVNPAALGLSSVDELYIAGSMLVDHVAIDQRVLDASTNAFSAGPHVRSNRVGFGGTLAYVGHINNTLTLGISARTQPVEMFPAGQTSLEFFSLGGGERVYSGAASATGKLTDELYIGVSLSAERRALHLRYARDTALAAGSGPGGVNSDCKGSTCGFGNPYAAEIYDVQVTSSLLSQDAITVNLGAAYAFTKDIILAAAYHTVPGVDAVENSLTGKMVVTPAPSAGACPGCQLVGGSTVNVQEPASVDAELRVRAFGRLDTHVGFRWEDLSRFESYDVRGYGSTFPAAGIPEWTEIPRGFHDPFSLTIGVEELDAGGIGLTNRAAWRFGARIGAETPSLDTDRTSPITIDPFSFTFDVGAQVRLTDRLVLLGTYGLQLYVPVHVDDSKFDPRDRVNCINDNFDYSTTACENTRLGYAIATAAGDYERLEHAFSLALRVRM